MDRLTTSLLPARLVDRVGLVTARLAVLVPPRVHSAVYRTWFNGWCTSRRFRTCMGQDRVRSSSCLFGCSQTAEDSIEHCVLCPHVCLFMQRYFGIKVAINRPEALTQWFLCDRFGARRRIDCVGAFLICGVYGDEHFAKSHPGLQRRENL